MDVEMSMDIEAEKRFVCIGIEKYGGSFIKGIGQALSRADINNTIKIKLTWPDEWKYYLNVGIYNAVNNEKE